MQTWSRRPRVGGDHDPAPIGAGARRCAEDDNELGRGLRCVEHGRGACAAQTHQARRPSNDRPGRLPKDLFRQTGNKYISACCAHTFPMEAVISHNRPIRSFCAVPQPGADRGHGAECPARLRPPPAAPPRAHHHRAERGNSVAAPLDAAFGHKSVAAAPGGAPAPAPTMSAAPPTGPRWAPTRSADPG